MKSFVIPDDTVLDRSSTNTQTNIPEEHRAEAFFTNTPSSRRMGVVTIVIFIGILLSFAINFSLSTLLGSGELCDEYFDGKTHDDIVFPAFCDQLFLSQSQRDLIVSYDYLIFNKLSTSDVMLGHDEFLFPVEEEDTRYNYIADYIGDYDPSVYELEAYTTAIKKITDAYDDLGKDCYFVIIPNSQTVYSDKMPDFFGDISENTRLSVLSSYMSKKNINNYLDLTDALKNAKQYGELYNNTENSLNARGAYFAYMATLELFPESVQSKLTPLELLHGELVSYSTEGKQLAKTANLSKVIKNRSVALSSDFPQMYTILERRELVEMAFAKLDYRDVLPSRPIVQFQFSTEWDRIIMIDYYSNTFGTTAYTTTLSFNQKVLDATSASHIVFFIHEYELHLLRDSSLLPQIMDNENVE